MEHCRTDEYNTHRRVQHAQTSTTRTCLENSYETLNSNINEISKSDGKHAGSGWGKI